MHYARRWLAFVRVHYEAWGAAHLDQSAASGNELERLRREYQTLPPRHLCSCRCYRQEVGHPACPECQRVQQHMRDWQIPVEPGSRRGLAHSPTPDPLLLDLVAGFAA